MLPFDHLIPGDLDSDEDFLSGDQRGVRDETLGCRHLVAAFQTVEEAHHIGAERNKKKVWLTATSSGKTLSCEQKLTNCCSG